MLSWVVSQNGRGEVMSNDGKHVNVLAGKQRPWQTSCLMSEFSFHVLQLPQVSLRS